MKRSAPGDRVLLADEHAVHVHQPGADLPSRHRRKHDADGAQAAARIAAAACGVMLPPETTATTGPVAEVGDLARRAARRRRPRRRPRRRASRARRGSACRRAISSSLEVHDLVDVLDADAQAELADRGRGQRVGDRRAAPRLGAAPPARGAGAREARSVAVASGWTRDHARAGASALTAIATPDTRPPPLAGTSTAPGAGIVGADLEPDRRPARRSRAGRRRGAARRARSAAAKACIRANASAPSCSLEVDASRRSRASPRPWPRWRVRGMKTTRSTPASRAGERRRLRVRCRPTRSTAPRRALLRGQRGDAVDRAAQLEGAGPLEELGLEVGLPADDLAEAARGEDRRAVHASGERARGRLAVLEVGSSRGPSLIRPAYCRAAPRLPLGSGAADGRALPARLHATPQRATAMSRKGPT